MNYCKFLIIVAFIFSLGIAPLAAKVVEGLSLQSNLLNTTVHYAVYLPADYDQSTRKYPVVYLLHGYTDNESAWIQFGEVNQAVDAAIEERVIPPMIIVMPDAGATYYINNADKTYPYADMFFQEFIPFIDATYRTRADRSFRAVSGLSMGGYGALLYAMQRPDLFSGCAAFSAAVRTREEYKALPQERFEFFQKLYGGNNDDKITQHWIDNNPLELVRTLTVESLSRVSYYIDCGDDDYLISGNCALHLALKDRNIRHEFRVRNGEHSWVYWRTGIIAGLQFICSGFNE